MSDYFLRDVHHPVRPSFHQAHQGGLSPSEGLTPSAVAGEWGDRERQRGGNPLKTTTARLERRDLSGPCRWWC
jgi:hypothetical protein